MEPLIDIHVVGMFHHFVLLKRLTCAAGCSRAAEAFLSTSCYDPFLWQQCVLNGSPIKVKEIEKVSFWRYLKMRG